MFGGWGRQFCGCGVNKRENVLYPLSGMDDFLREFKLQPGQMPGLIGQVKNNPEVGGFLSDLAGEALGGGGGDNQLVAVQAIGQ